jgi:hypothetical protein
MKQFVLVACVLCLAVFVAGCKKESTPLVKSDGTPAGQVVGSTTGEAGSETGTPGDVPGDSTTGTAAPSPLGSGALSNNNPSINDSGEMIKQDGGNPPPPGRVWCDNCHGHLPKEDAVTKDGKTYCMACAAELKIGN